MNRLLEAGERPRGFACGGITNILLLPGGARVTRTLKRKNFRDVTGTAPAPRRFSTQFCVFIN